MISQEEHEEPFRPGDIVTLPDGGVAAVERMIGDDVFDGLANILFEPSALGSLFFESPLQAIQFFLTARRLEIESLDRKKMEAERAIAWAQSQPGLSAQTPSTSRMSLLRDRVTKLLATWDQTQTTFGVADDMHAAVEALRDVSEMST